jgi:hypothetical protein
MQIIVSVKKSPTGVSVYEYYSSLLQCVSVIFRPFFGVFEPNKPEFKLALKMSDDYFMVTFFAFCI